MSTTSKLTPIQKFAAIQRRIKTLGFNETAGAGKYQFQYVSLVKFKKVFDPICEELGIAYEQPLDILEGNNILRTILWDTETGEEIAESAVILHTKNDNNPQEWGSAITYFRRYSLFSLLGIMHDRDDDVVSSPESIRDNVAQINTVEGLMRYYRGLIKEQQEEYKELFGERRKEIESASQVLNNLDEQRVQEIINNTKVQ